MRVNLSYSVEIEEVLTAVEKLYKENKDKFEKDYNILTNISPLHFSNTSIESTLRTVGELANALEAYKTKLEELAGILTGYNNLVDPPAPPPQPELPSLDLSLLNEDAVNEAQPEGLGPQDDE